MLVKLINNSIIVKSESDNDDGWKWYIELPRPPIYDVTKQAVPIYYETETEVIRDYKIIDVEQSNANS